MDGSMGGKTLYPSNICIYCDIINNVSNVYLKIPLRHTDIPDHFGTIFIE